MSPGGSAATRSRAPSPTRFASVGRAVFEWLVLFMLLLVLFLVPGFTSGAIAGERERQTLVPLQVTLLRPWQIVVGKLTASFAFLALLVVAAAPLLAVAYLIGGVTIGVGAEGRRGRALHRAVPVGVTVCCSALFRRVQIATVVSYAVVLVLLVGTLLVWAAAGIIDAPGATTVPTPRRSCSPSTRCSSPPTSSPTRTWSSRAACRSPFEPMVDVLLRDRYGVDDVITGEVFIDGPIAAGGGGRFFPGGGGITDGLAFAEGESRPIIGFDQFGNPIFADGEEGFPFWALSVIALYLFAAGASLLAVHRLRTPATSER